MKQKIVTAASAVFLIAAEVLSFGLLPKMAYGTTVYPAFHPLGTNISGPDGTVYTITTENGQTVRRPYTSSAAFLSYSFNSWSGVTNAYAGDSYLPVGSFIPPRDGTIMCSDRGADKGTCYLISKSQKLGFPSESIFGAQGFSFQHALYGDVSFLPSGPVITNPNQAHSPGTIINKDGTLYFIGNDGLGGFPSVQIFTGWGYVFTDAVKANLADRSFVQTAVLQERPPGTMSPYQYYNPVVQINSLNPTTGPVGTSVVITGTGFTSDNKISFGNSSLGTQISSYPSWDGKTIIFTIPSEITPPGPGCVPPIYCAPAMPRQVQPGTYNISLTNINGTSNSLIFTVSASPAISQLSPASGPVGTQVTIIGSGFTSTNNSVSFGSSVIQNISSANGTNLTFTVPSWTDYPCFYTVPQCLLPTSQITPGIYNVSVTNLSGSSNIINFTVTP